MALSVWGRIGCSLPDSPCLKRLVKCLEQRSCSIITMLPLYAVHLFGKNDHAGSMASVLDPLVLGQGDNAGSVPFRINTFHQCIGIASSGYGFFVDKLIQFVDDSLFQC